MEHICSRFMLEGHPVSCERHGNGHINHTCFLMTDQPHAYILQRMKRIWIR